MPGRNKQKLGNDIVSDLTASRLSVYLRCLNVLDEDGQKTVSSRTLAEGFQLNAAQIRKDLANFGEFGVRGVGYYVKDLKQHLRKILGLDRTVRIAIFGAGNLGMALADYPGFRRKGFEIVGLFDSAKHKVGLRSRGGIPIFSVDSFKKTARDQAVDIAVIAVPVSAAQGVVDTAVAGGVRAILNFSPGVLMVPGNVKVKTMDLMVSMESLSFFLARGGSDGDA